MEKLGQVVRSVTLFAAEAAFLGLVTSFVIQTFRAKSGSPPDLAEVQVSAAGALAVALGAGFAITLGLPKEGGGTASFGAAVKDIFEEKFWLSVGVLAYMVAGFAACAAYGLNEAEAPGILKTIAVGFGGYVIAYIGMAYRELK